MKQRIPYLDWLRVIACMMVFTVHACECIYSNDYSFSFPSETARWSVIVYQSLVRSAVPLFLIASAFLLVPVKTDTATFFKRRFTRVVIPLFVFLFLYAVVPYTWGGQTWDQTLQELKTCFITFPVSGSHLWFVYMLLGIYIIMPVISPWLSKIGKREELAYILLWLFSTTFYRLRQVLGCSLFGECWWGNNSMFYYFSGYIGYVVLAHYIRFHVDWSTKKVFSLCIPIWLIGTAICLYSGEWYSTRCDTPAVMEQDWQFYNFVPVCISFAAFMMISKIKSSGWFYQKVILPISTASYGMYLMHMLILPHYFALYNPLMPEYFTIPLTVISTYITTFVIAWALQKLPFGKYIVG